MTDSPAATQLLDRWRAGDEDAATELFELFSHKLTAVAERHLSQRLSQRVDGEDVVQSAFRTFFRRGERGDFTIAGSAGLWRLLVTITLAKARSQGRRHTSPKRDVAAEVTADSRLGELALLAREPGPDEALMLVELMRAMVEGLPETYAEILSLRLSGHTRAEIALKLTIARQTVYRALNVMQQRLETLSAGGSVDG